jgi:RimJ/RimL family protein N-acetyltransferase
MITLLPLDRTDWEAVAADPEAFARERQLSLGAAPELLRVIAAQTVSLLDQTGAAAAPWSGYLAVSNDRVVVGTCGFKAPPDRNGVVEIAYFTFPNFEGKGYASAMAADLVKRGEREVIVHRIQAHTLPERNASTRILEKTGFAHVGEVVDPEDGPVWRWERTGIG